MVAGEGRVNGGDISEGYGFSGLKESEKKKC